MGWQMAWRRGMQNQSLKPGQKTEDPDLTLQKNVWHLNIDGTEIAFQWYILVYSVF
jgi:glucan phosphorylase